MRFTTEWFGGKPEGWFAFCQRTARGGSIRRWRWQARLDGLRIMCGHSATWRPKKLRINITYR